MDSDGKNAGWLSPPNGRMQRPSPAPRGPVDSRDTGRQGEYGRTRKTCAEGSVRASWSCFVAMENLSAGRTWTESPEAQPELRNLLHLRLGL